MRSYLKRCRAGSNIRPLISPPGKTSAFDWVIEQYPAQVNAYRLARAKKHIWLIVVVDADMGSVERRLGQLRLHLEQANDLRLRELRIESETIARLVPRRNIETWILALNGEDINEDDDYKNGRSREEWQALVHTASGTFYDLTRPNARGREHRIESLRRGIEEMIRLFQLSG